MAKEWTAAQTVRYGQSLAGASAEIDRLVGILQNRDAEVGEHQALADVCALVSDRGTAELAGLLTAALWQLSGLNEKTKS
jgi:hypothetical protein